MLSIAHRPAARGFRRTALRPLALAAWLLLAPAAMAQQAAGQPIEQQMSPEQFRAAGLDKLSTQELANLNAWLNKTLEVETTKAASLAKDKVETENRGFLSFGSDEPIVGRIAGEFRGFGRGRTWTLDNGQAWEQTDDASLAGVRLDAPQVSIAPGIGNVWYMAIKGYNTRAKVRRTK